MFSTLPLWGRSAFAVFVMVNKKHPALQGLAIADRGRATAQLYKSQSPAEFAKLKAKAALLPAFERGPNKVKRTKKSKHQASCWLFQELRATENGGDHTNFTRGGSNRSKSMICVGGTMDHES